MAEGAAQDVLQQSSSLPGHPQWPAQALAAKAVVALYRGDTSTAAEFGRHALAVHDAAMREDLDLEIILPAVEAVLARGDVEETKALRDRLQMVLGFQSQRILDEKVRVEWFRSQTGRDLTRLAGSLVRTEIQDPSPNRTGLADADSLLLGLLVEGNLTRLRQPAAARCGLSRKSTT